MRAGTKAWAWFRRLRARLQSCPRFFAGALREVFDESAYARFLQRTQVPSSPEAYAAFCREWEAARARRPRCC
jgi:hypothetical protein